MTDFHLALSNPISAPGTYTFVAVNAGQDEHAIEIDGPGVSDQRTPGVVQPGHSASLTVTLQPGSYDMYCPVDGHRAMGMDTHFTVGAAGETGSSSPEPGNGGGGY
ncbi:MAG: plastocyanin/azurin family copper-binding protein [Pseudonocardiaceae bacterium]